MISRLFTQSSSVQGSRNAESCVLVMKVREDSVILFGDNHKKLCFTSVIKTAATAAAVILVLV